MREFKFNLPLNDNDGAPLSWLHNSIQSYLCDAFKGFTVTQGLGGWKDGKAVMTEPNAIYTVAINNEKPLLEDCFIQVIKEWGEKAGQFAIYIVDTSGKARVIELRDTHNATTEALRTSWRTGLPVFEDTSGAFPIRLYHDKARREFTLEYGKQVETCANYVKAAHKLGEAILHCAVCDGKLDTNA